MAWYVWTILLLVLVSWGAYTYPDKVNPQLAKIFDPLNDAIGTKVNNVIPTNNCPSTIQPVCGNGITYDNSCIAGLADVLNVTQGACT